MAAREIAGDFHSSYRRFGQVRFLLNFVEGKKIGVESRLAHSAPPWFFMNYWIAP